jgi:polyisoprenoid-binding protein YceI
MLNVILLSLALFSTDGIAAESYNANIDESTVLWTASKVVGKTHNGTLNLASGSLDIESGKLTGGSFELDMTTIANTDVEGEWKAKLEGHLKSEDFFSVEKFKTSSLKFTNVTSTGDNTYNVTADITIKGKTESISFPATVSVDGAKLKATAKLTIDRSKFDVRYGSSSFFDDLGDKAISDEFTIEVNLVANK